MNQEQIDTPKKAYQLGSALEKNVKDATLAVAIFDKLATPLKWCFLQGHWEKNGRLEETPTTRVVIVSKMVELLYTFADFVKTPHLFGENNEMFYDDMNAIDLLGEIYKGGCYSTNTGLYDRYISILSPIGTCLVYKTCPDAILPSKTRVSDVGYDLTIIRKVKPLNNVVSLYDTGIKIRVPIGYYTEIVPRSSLSKSGYILANSVGIIDRSYNGNLYIALAKVDGSAPDIIFPFRCCQLIVRKQHHVLWKETNHDLEATARGEGGFGSTG